MDALIKSYLGKEESADVCFLGICGMGGIGKTAIARAVHTELSHEFEGSCFLANVREAEEENGLVSLQEKLLSETLMERNIMVWDVHGEMNQIKSRLSHKKVLIILALFDSTEEIEVDFHMCIE